MKNSPVTQLSDVRAEREARRKETEKPSSHIDYQVPLVAPRKNPPVLVLVAIILLTVAVGISILIHGILETISSCFENLTDYLRKVRDKKWIDSGSP